MKNRKTWLVRIAFVAVLIAIGGVMMVIGRGHTVYLDNKKLEYNGAEYGTPYKVEVYVDGERVAKLYDRERGMATCIGQTFRMTLEITQEKGGDATTQSYELALPYNMDGVIINLPAYLAGLGEDAYLSEFIPSPEEAIPEDTETPGGEDGMEFPGMEESAEALPDA